MKKRRADRALCKASMAKHAAQTGLSRLTRMRMARETIRQKFRESDLPQPSPRKMKQLVDKCLAATGDPPRRAQRVSLGQGMQAISDKMRKAQNAVVGQQCVAGHFWPD